MPDEHETLVSEIQRLRKTNGHWRAIAIAALVLVFVVMMPFTLGVKEAIKYFSRRYDENARIENDLEKQRMLELEQMLHEKGQ